MSREDQIDQAWAKFQGIEKSLTEYLVSPEFHPVRHQELSEAAKAALDEVLNQISGTSRVSKPPVP